MILIGELRDAETAQTALQAAESGHLVFSTMHTIDAAETVGRLVEFFPPLKQQQVRSILAGVLQRRHQPAAAPAPRRRPRPGRRDDGHERAHRRAAARGKSEEIEDAIADGEFIGMQTFNQALIALVLDGNVDREVAAGAATNRHDFLVALEHEEKRPRRTSGRGAGRGRRADGRRGAPTKSAPIPYVLRTPDRRRRRRQFACAEQTRDAARSCCWRP